MRYRRPMTARECRLAWANERVASTRKPLFCMDLRADAVPELADTWDAAYAAWVRAKQASIDCWGRGGPEQASLRATEALAQENEYLARRAFRLGMLAHAGMI